MFVVVTKTHFYIFENRLEFKSKHPFDKKFGSVTQAAFNYNGSQCYLGTSEGYILTWDLKSDELSGKPFNADPEFQSPVTHLQRFSGVDSENIFLVTLGAN